MHPRVQYQWNKSLKYINPLSNVECVTLHVRPLVTQIFWSIWYSQSGNSVIVIASYEKFDYVVRMTWIETSYKRVKNLRGRSNFHTTKETIFPFSRNCGPPIGRLFHSLSIFKIKFTQNTPKYCKLRARSNLNLMCDCRKDLASIAMNISRYLCHPAFRRQIITYRAASECKMF